MPSSSSRGLFVLFLLALILISVYALYRREREYSLVELLIEAEMNPKAVKKALRILEERLNRTGSPLIEENKVIFIYISDMPVEIWVAGDWNGWSPSTDHLSRLGKTQIYYLIKEFPENARVEYKFVVGEEWIPDPLNEKRAVDRPDHSVLMMPSYTESIYTSQPWKDLKGRLTSLTIESRWLDRNVSLHVYTPPNYWESANYPTIYFQDGSEYIKFGAHRILDIMISKGEIRPLIAVFIDPKYRSCEYAMEDDYVNFLSEELVPFIDKRYNTSRVREDRCIVGDSLGGLMALYVALMRPEIFGVVITQSGAFVPPRVLSTVCPKATNRDIFSVAAKPGLMKLRIYMQWGKYDQIHWIDLYEENKKMTEILEEAGHDVTIMIVPEGHNWGNWINHLPDALKDLFIPVS